MTTHVFFPNCNSITVKFKKGYRIAFLFLSKANPVLDGLGERWLVRPWSLLEGLQETGTEHVQK